MAPNLASAHWTYGQAVAKLQSACIFLERQLPPVDHAEVEVVPSVPSLQPRVRAASVPNCLECEEELREQSPGAREGHRCNHHEGGEDVQVESNTFPEIRAPRRRQPNSGVIKQDLKKLDERYDAFAGAIGTLISLLDHSEAVRYETHMVVWADYCGWLTDRAKDLITLLEAATNLATTAVIPSQTQDRAVVNNEQNIELDHETVPSGSQSGQAKDGRPGGPEQGDQVDEVSLAGVITGNVDNSTQVNGTEAASGARVDVEIIASGPVGTDLDLAIRSLNHLYRSIERDLCTAENEVSLGGSPHTEYFLNEMKDFCSDVDKQINGDLKDAGEKVVRLDQNKVTGAAVQLSEKMANYSDRIRAVQSDLRRARGSLTPSPTGSIITPAAPSVTGSLSSYKPFIEKLKPPVFSGKVEDWPEFRRVWQDLLSGLPDSVQVQHIKTNIPANDAKRITSVRTMPEVWERLEKVYGNRYLNVITVKTNLESFVPKSSQDHKRVLKVFEAVETAVTQLQNLSALHYLQEDFSLMNKIVLKLPFVEQTKYTDYVTSEVVKASTASRWEKFWTWFKQRHESAVQAGLMFNVHVRETWVC